MKPFVFSLERMRNYREQILNREKDALAKLQKNRDDIKTKISGLEQYRITTSMEMHERERMGVDAFEISAYRFLMKNTQHQIEDLHHELARANEDVAKQLKTVIAASRERTSLDKLEEKQMEEYRVQASRAEEQNISEHVTMTLVRKHVEL